MRESCVDFLRRKRVFQGGDVDRMEIVRIRIQEDSKEKIKRAACVSRIDSSE
jgi:hypothetical protein